MNHYRTKKKKKIESKTVQFDKLTVNYHSIQSKAKKLKKIVVHQQYVLENRSPVKFTGLYSCYVSRDPQEIWKTLFLLMQSSYLSSQDNILKSFLTGQFS